MPEAQPEQPKGGRPAIGKPTGLRLPQEMVDEYDAVADSLGLERSTVMRNALSDWLKVFKKHKPGASS